MSTFIENLKKKLAENGMSEEQAEDVMAEVIKHDSLSDMKQRWKDDVSGYSPAILSSLWIIIKPLALEWIDEHKPEAFFRVMFEPS